MQTNRTLATKRMLELRNARGEKGTQTLRPRDVKCHYTS